MIDPFTQIGLALSRSLYGFAPLAAAVTIGNRIALWHDIYRQPKTNTGPANVELELSQRGFRLAPFKGNSLSGEFTAQYPVLVSVPHTNRLELDKANQLTWLVCCALAAAGPKLGLPSLVRDWEIQDGEGFRLSAENDWSSLAIVAVSFSVRITDMLDFNPAN